MSFPCRQQAKKQIELRTINNVALGCVDVERSSEGKGKTCH